jgi:hypothetical protein
MASFIGVCALPQNRLLYGWEHRLARDKLHPISGPQRSGSRFLCSLGRCELKALLVGNHNVPISDVKIVTPHSRPSARPGDLHLHADGRRARKIFWP